MEKKEQVYQHIRSDTITKLKEEQFESLGLDTLTVSLDLKMNRAISGDCVEWNPEIAPHATVINIKLQIGLPAGCILVKWLQISGIV